MIFCSNCGRENKGEKFCPECGTNLSSEQRDIEDLSTSGERRNIKVIILSTFLVVAVIAGAAFYFLTKDSASTYINRACESMSQFDPYTKGGDERLVKARSLQLTVREDVEIAQEMDPDLASPLSRAFATLNEYVDSLEKWEEYLNLHLESYDVSFLALAIAQESNYETLALSLKSQVDSACSR